MNAPCELSQMNLADTAALLLDPAERTRCEVWTRVMGYHRPVASFNIGKKGEHRERRFFREACARLDAAV
jgi:anaerobic ribonucleoside-triphosphate reductase